MTFTVASYLKQRLEELGLKQMFGVAGNYTAPLLDTILEDENSPIKISGNPNEICAGFAADAYARTQGVGAVYVTYSVGAFSLLNTIAGSYVEQVPVILINGAPTNKESAIETNAGLLYSHTTGYQAVDIHMFRPVTAAAERITSAAQAIYQIDSALTAMLTHQRPVYLEVAEDVWRVPCDQPLKVLSARENSIAVSEEQQAINATLELLAGKDKVAFWAGVELQRFGLEDEFLALLQDVNSGKAGDSQIGFVTSALSKSVISEDNEYFQGCVTLTEETIEDLVGDDGAIIGLGAWTIGKDTGNQNIRSSSTILAAQGGVLVGAKYFPVVSLQSYVAGLQTAIAALPKEHPAKNIQPLSMPVAPKLSAAQLSGTHASTGAVEINYDSFFAQLNTWLGPDNVLVVDAGFPLIGAQSVHIGERGGFLAQAAWLSIGYSVPAATGVACARPDKRPVVVVGDGSFHETCQAISDHAAYGHNTVVFVLANGIYGIEQYLVNPNPFREPPVDYENPLENKVYSYNELPKWDFAQLAEGFGGQGRSVDTLAELVAVMDEIRDRPDANFVVEVKIPKTATPHTITTEAGTAVGEDETSNPNWPPASKF